MIWIFRGEATLTKSIFEDILSLVLQNRFADLEPLSDPQNEALFEILKSRGRLRHLTDWPWKIDHNSSAFQIFAENYF